MALGLVVGGIGSQVVHAQQTPMKRTPLAKMDVEGIGQAEATMIRAEFAPGAAAGKHYHPGPEMVYVLEGAGTLEVEGKAPVDVKAGEHFSLMAEERHDLKNASQTEPLRVVAFLVAEKGQPLAVMVDQPMAEQSPAAGTSGAAAPQSGSATSSGAASSGAQPSASPR